VLFGKILQTGALPLDWKDALVVPIHKGGDKHAVENYIPVSLTSLSCKVFEHILYSNIIAHLKSNNLLASQQHGFSKNLSCETQATALLHDLCRSMDNKKQVDAIFLDFSKAFDRVSHVILIEKLKIFALNLKCINVIKNFLSDRRQMVVVGGNNSTMKPVTSGVPQGSVLGPLLFLLFVNDLCQNLSSNIRLFADDTVLYREISSAEDHSILQSDLDKIAKWCEENKMSLNVTKCKVMNVCRLHAVSGFDYTLNDCILETVSKYKYLGIFITSNLSWDTHVNYICSRANRSLGFIKRQLGKCSPEIKLKAYTTLVRPHLEYASCAWDPNSSTLIDVLEMVQHRAARFILHKYSRFESVTDMLKELDLSELHIRRKNARLCLFYKIHYKLTPLATPEQLSLKATQRRTDNGVSYQHFKCHTDPFYSSFFPWTVRDWNSLPADSVTLTSLDLFSSVLASSKKPE